MNSAAQFASLAWHVAEYMQWYVHVWICLHSTCRWLRLTEFQIEGYWLALTERVRGGMRGDDDEDEDDVDDDDDEDEDKDEDGDEHGEEDRDDIEDEDEDWHWLRWE